MQITTIEQLQAVKKTQIIELPGFDDGTPFICEVKKPNMMQLISSGKIPNSLLAVAMDLFNNNGGKTMKKAETDAKSLKELVGMMNIIADSTLLNPSYETLKKAGIELNDDQLMALLIFSQNGVKALENFRMQRTSDTNTQSV